MKRSRTTPPKGRDTNKPLGRADFSALCPAGGLFVDLTAIRFIQRYAGIDRARAQAEFNLLVATGIIVAVRGLGYTAEEIAYQVAADVPAA